jgi:hypothetical protein
MRLSRRGMSVGVAFILALFFSGVCADAATDDPMLFGVKVRIGGRYDNVRQLGISPYVTPLFGIGDPQNHRGVVIGGLVDGLFRFGGKN